MVQGGGPRRRPYNEIGFALQQLKKALIQAEFRPN
jgi:hypothetical protein